MDHVAYLKKSWGFLPKILSGAKRIESRWYKNKSLPWGKIKVGDTVYFKNSGSPAEARALVGRVLQFSNLTPSKVHAIFVKYYQLIGFDSSQFNYFYQLFKNKKYCLLIFLKNPRKVLPFEVNKTGFGVMSAWITIKNIDTIRVQIRR
jgi:ASC-1-like (ASCH) protein